MHKKHKIFFISSTGQLFSSAKKDFWPRTSTNWFQNLTRSKRWGNNFIFFYLRPHVCSASIQQPYNHQIKSSRVGYDEYNTCCRRILRVCVGRCRESRYNAVFSFFSFSLLFGMNKATKFWLTKVIAVSNKIISFYYSSIQNCSVCVMVKFMMNFPCSNFFMQQKNSLLHKNCCQLS